MSLDVYVSKTANVREASQGQRRLTLEDDGILRCLQSFAGALPSATGHPIDAYADAVFDPSLLPALHASLAKARAHYMAGPATLEVWVGTEIKPQRRELFEQVTRLKLVRAISTLEALAEEALNTNQCLVFVGD